MNLIINFVFVSISLLKWIIIIHVVMSLFRVQVQNKLFKFLSDILDPVYGQIKKFPHSIGIIDFSPLIALLLLDLLSYLIMNFIIA